MVCGSDGKESPCNAGDLSLIPGWGRSPGKRNGYPLQCSCLEKSMEEEPGWLQSMGSQRVRHDWATNTISDGPVVKNPPCNSGDVGSIPGWGTKIPHPTEQLSPHAATMMPVGSKTHHEDPAHQKKKGGGRNYCVKAAEDQAKWRLTIDSQYDSPHFCYYWFQRCFYHPVHLHVCESLCAYFLFSPTDLFIHLELCDHWNFHSWRDKHHACPHLFFKNIIASL